MDPRPAFNDAERRAVDKALTTTRAVRLRLDLTRPVAQDTLLDCIDIAEQAPCGGAQPSRRWLIVQDAELRARVGAWYRDVLYPGLYAEFHWPVPGHADFTGGPTGDSQLERVFRSALHLGAVFEQVPVLVLCTIYGEHDQAGSPGLFDSVMQAGWSFCLAARARGLGTCWTTAHLGRAGEIGELLGIPAGVTQVALFPVAHTLGTEFRPADRPRAADITFFDQWGLGTDTVTLEVDIAGRAPAAVWPQVVAACEQRGRRTEAAEPESCGWTAADHTGRFSLRPRIYGGTRLGCALRFPHGATREQLLAVRAELAGALQAFTDA